MGPEPTGFQEAPGFRVPAGLVERGGMESRATLPNVTVAVPLISAALAGFVPWLVTLRQGRTAQEDWVLDKRHILYEGGLEAVAPLNAARSQDEAVDATLDPKFRARLTNALLGRVS